MINKRVGAACSGQLRRAGPDGLQSRRRAGGEEPAASQSGSGTFTKEVSGTLKISGFNPSDEVGTSREDYAKQQLAGVTIELDTTNFDPQKFAAQAASGNVPDLLQMDRSVVATLADKDLIVPLDECYAVHGVTPDQQYYPSTIGDVTYDGKVYAVPQFFQPLALMVNKRVLEKAGVSLDQLDTSKPDQIVAVAEKLRSRRGATRRCSASIPTCPARRTCGSRSSAAAPTTTPASPRWTTQQRQSADLDEAGDGRAGRLRQGQVLQGHVGPFGDKNQFVQDQVAVQTAQQWYVNVLSNTKDDVSLAAVPIKTLEGEPLAMAGGTAFAVAAAGKNKSAACAWAINATSEAAWTAAGQARAKTVEEKKSINTGLFTASPAADEAVRTQFVKPSGNADFDQVISTFYDVLPGNKSRGASAVGQIIDQNFNNAVSVALTGEKDPQAALADAQAASLRAWDQSKAGKK